MLYGSLIDAAHDNACAHVELACKLQLMLALVHDLDECVTTVSFGGWFLAKRGIIIKGRRSGVS
jgi:hypothetical protein